MWLDDERIEVHLAASGVGRRRRASGWEEAEEDELVVALLAQHGQKDVEGDEDGEEELEEEEEDGEEEGEEEGEGVGEEEGEGRHLACQDRGEENLSNADAVEV